jgi:hypothetical protein
MFEPQQTVREGGTDSSALLWKPFFKTGTRSSSRNSKP